MPEEMFEIGLEDVILSQFEEGKIVRGWDIEEEEERTVHYRIKNLRAMMNEIYQVYSKKNSTKRDFVKVIKDHQKKHEDDVQNFLDQLENDDKLFEVAERQEDKDGNITIKLKKVDQTDRIALIRSITEKLMKKMKPEQLRSLLEEGVRKNNSTDKLKNIDKKLDDEDVKVEGKKGCFKFAVGDEDIFVMG